ncbi:unnamed protein product [Symbiodinium sp. CCMP2592]|nr:unnamed protein product [Symbiodinium sp. CCMP2592]
MRRSPCGLSCSAFALAVVTGLLHFEAAAYTPLVSPGTGVPHYLGVPAGKLLRKHQPPRVLDHRQKHAVAIDGHANLVDVGRSFNLGRPESLAAQEPEAEAAAEAPAEEAPAEEAPAEEGAEAASGEGEAATETAAEEGAEASADATEGAAAGGAEGAKDDAAEGTAEGASAAAAGGASEAATEATAEGSVAASAEGATAGAAAAPAAAAAGAVVEGSVAGTTGAATTAAATTVAAVAAAATTAVPTTVALAAGKAPHHKVKAVAPAAKGAGAAKGTQAAASSGTPGAGLPWKGIILVLSIVALVVFLGPKLYEMATAKPPLPGRLNEIKSEPSDQQVWASSKARQTYRKSVLAAQSNKSSSDSEDAAAKPAPRGSAASAGSREAGKAPAAASPKEKEAKEGKEKEGNSKEAKDTGGTASREEAPRASTSSRQRSPSASSGSYRARRTAANKSSGNWPGLRCRSTEDSPYRCLMEVEQRYLAAARKDPATGLPICGTCARLGHPLCGLRYWITLRAAWLRLPEELVAEEPHSFEDPGSVQIARQAQIGFVREISEGEAEDLEDCLDAIQRPFPLLRRPIPLSQAGSCRKRSFLAVGGGRAIKTSMWPQRAVSADLQPQPCRNACVVCSLIHQHCMPWFVRSCRVSRRNESQD